MFVVIFAGIYNVFSAFFFFVVTPRLRLYGPRYSPCPIFVMSEIQSMTFHRTIMTQQLFELTLRSFVVVFVVHSLCQLLHRSKIRVHATSVTSIITAAFCCRKYSFFCRHFFVFIFIFMSIPIFVLAFIITQTAIVATFSRRVQSFALMRLRASTSSILSAACLSVKFIIPRIRNVMFAELRVQRIYTLITSG